MYFCFFCFRLVYLSFCIYNRTNTYNNIKHINSFEKHINITKQKYSFSQRSLRYIYSWSGRGLDILYFCFLFLFFSKLFCFFFVFLLIFFFFFSCFLFFLIFFVFKTTMFFCFRLVYLSFCLNTTQYTTPNTNNLKWVCSWPLSNAQSNVQIHFKLHDFRCRSQRCLCCIEVNSKRCISPMREHFFVFFAPQL